ncbi:hypothetical protein GCK32_016042, partial [Trichostrongylus colubriformis]
MMTGNGMIGTRILWLFHTDHGKWAEWYPLWN